MSGYFEFTGAEKTYLEQINQDFDRGLSPYAAKNSSFVRLEDKWRYDIIRPPYSYDTDCIIHNPLYNRYTDKTQVFSFYKNDDLSRRALHVQFVSKIGKTVGRALGLNLDLIEAIALGHDMGHTPFGHKGEEFLSQCYQKGCRQSGRQPRYFNHNVHSARIFRYLLNSNLTLQTLSGILSHNGEKVCQNYAPSALSTFEEFDRVLECCYLEDSYHKKLRPNTLEGCVVRVSDMIAYAGRDRMDLHQARLIPDQAFREKRLIGTSNRDIISNLVINIIKNSIGSPALNMDKEVFDDLRDLIEENYRVIYGNQELNAPYYEIIQPLMEKLYTRLAEDAAEGAEDSPVFRHYLNDPVQGRFYREDPAGPVTADPNDIVTDFIASMTDDYFIDICKALRIDDDLVGRLKYHEYFDF